MELIYTDDGDDCIDGAVIQRAEVVDGWTRIFLVDGRTILFPDCAQFAIVYTREIVH
jgi:hypothetical protein